MLRATRYVSDALLRRELRERPLAMLLATLVAERRHAADLALEGGDFERASMLEEAAALAAHRLGQLEDAQFAIIRSRRPESSPEQEMDFPA